MNERATGKRMLSLRKSALKTAIKIVAAFLFIACAINGNPAYAGPCKKFKTTIIIDGKAETAFGTVCQDSNGEWKKTAASQSRITAPSSTKLHNEDAKPPKREDVAVKERPTEYGRVAGYKTQKTYGENRVPWALQVLFWTGLIVAYFAFIFTVRRRGIEEYDLKFFGLQFWMVFLGSGFLSVFFVQDNDLDAVNRTIIILTGLITWAAACYMNIRRSNPIFGFFYTVGQIMAIASIMGVILIVLIGFQTAKHSRDSYQA